MQGYKDTRIQGYKVKRIQGYKARYKDTRIKEYKDARTPVQKNTRIHIKIFKKIQKKKVVDKIFIFFRNEKSVKKWLDRQCTAAEKSM